MIEDKLLEVAIVQFGQHGLEGASTRAIAKAASTAMSSITYHYGGKDGLYLATADYIAGQMLEKVQPVLQLVPPAGAVLSPDEANEQIARLLDAYAQIMISSDSEHWARFVMREQMQPTEAFERLFATAIAPILTVMVRLIGIATGIIDPREIRLLGLTMFGQVIIFRAGRATAEKALGGFDTATEAAIRVRIRRNIHAILIAARNEP